VNPTLRRAIQKYELKRRTEGKKGAAKPRYGYRGKK
jgi:hypothetical protein